MSGDRAGVDNADDGTQLGVSPEPPLPRVLFFVQRVFSPKHRQRWRIIQQPTVYQKSLSGMSVAGETDQPSERSVK